MCVMQQDFKISQDLKLLYCEPVIRTPNNSIVIDPLESLIPLLQDSLHYEFMLTNCSSSTVVSN